MLGALALSLPSSVSAAAGPPADAPGEFIVVLREGVDAPAVAQEHRRVHALGVDRVYSRALRGYAGRIRAEQVARVRADPRVAFVSENRPVQATGPVPIAPGEAAPTGVRRIEAVTAAAAHASSNVAVAVIDTGIDLSHPDLNVASGTNCVSPGSPAQDDNGHGTHVAGTIAALNNGAGVVGVAPGTKVYAVKVLGGSGGGTISQVICGIDWVTQNAAALNIKVANMSLGGTGASDNNCGDTSGDPLHMAICQSTVAGVTYVVAAGNSGTNLAGFTPAAYPEVLTVTAMADSDGLPGGAGGALACRTGGQDDSSASFSNYAVEKKDINRTIAAPGVCIQSTWLNGGYSTISGTSMATPHVAGTVALCVGNGSAGPCAGLSPAKIIQKVRADAKAHATSSNGFAGDPSRPVKGRYFGHLAWAGGY